MDPQDLHCQTMRYSIDELIKMRTSLPVICCVVPKLNKHPDIEVLLRIPKEAFTDPEHYMCKSTSLVGMKSNHSVPVTNSRNVGGLSDESGNTAIPAVITNGSQRVKWNLRPRESSDRSSQPHSAPTDLAAQQSENFKRFYRAVVSPSHVRVTAGGRIVPNTRAIGAPLFEWNNEKQIYESRKPSSDGELKPLRLAPLLPATAFGPAFPQLLPAGFFPAYNQVAQSGLQPLTASAVQNLGRFGSNANVLAPTGDLSVDALRSASTAQPIKISHPSQFDHSKPFMFNGQLVYPIPPGHLPPSYAHPVPVSMIGNQNLVPGAVPAPGFFMPQPAMPAASPNDLDVASYAQTTVPPHPHTNPPADNGGLYNPYLPLAGPTSVADITKFQIEGFRNHLSFINDQLANNQLGLDVQYLEGQRCDITALIEKMEAMLTLQLVYGRNPDAGTLLNGIIQFDAQHQPARSTMGESMQQDLGKDTGVLPCTRKEPVASSVPPVSHSNKAPNDSDSYQADGEGNTKGQTIPGSIPRMSRLTPAAAMAPPFQPRPQAMVASNSFSGISVPSTHYATSTASFGSRIASWAKSTHTATLSGAIENTPAASSTPHGPSVYTQKEDLHATIPGIHTVDAQYTSPSDQTTPLISPAAVPYLVGTVPQGVQGTNSKTIDLQYPRPLTDQERRARYLYWGRAPRSAYGGLPKFDGKDFYPPSPTKEPSRLRTASPIVRPHNPRHLTPIERNFEKLFAAPGATNYHNTSLDPNGHENKAPNTSRGTSVGSLRSQRSLNMPQESSRPGPLEHEEITHVLGAIPSAGHRKWSPAPSDLSKLFINADGSKPNSPGSARLSLRQFNSERARTKYGPGNVEQFLESEETKSVRSWRAPTDYSGTGTGKVGNGLAMESPRNISSTPSIIGAPDRLGHENSLPSRAESSSSSEQHTAFLQNMLKSAAQMGIAAPALRTLSSATAHGFLPHYRGSAAASLAPAMLSVPDTERDSDHRSPKMDQQLRSGVARTATPGLVNENQPLKSGQSPGHLPPTLDALDAEGYMRYLTQRADEDRRITEHGWHANASGSRRTPGTNW